MQGNRRKDKYGNDYISYRCGCRKQKRDCKNKEIKRDYLEEFILNELEKHVLNDSAIPVLAKEINKKLKLKTNNNEEQLKNIEDKLEKTNKEIQNILNAIMSGIVNNMLKDKLDELEQIKTNLEIRLIELKLENSNSDVINITEEQIKSMFSKFREYILTRNLPECKKFISQYIKEVIVYKDYVEVIFNVVFSFVNDEINHNVYITAKREEIK